MIFPLLGISFSLVLLYESLFIYHSQLMIYFCDIDILKIFFVCGCGIGILTQGFVFATQVLYCLSHTSSPFYSGYFGDKVLLFA
jgi:hypothetical protein